MLLRMAWRNLWRNRRRTILSLVSIAFGLFLCLTFTTLSDGSYGDMIDTAATMGAAHLVVQPKDYEDSPGMDLTLDHSKALVEFIESQAGVKKITPRIIAQSMAASANASLGAAVYAIDPKAEGEDLHMLKSIVEGENLPGTEGRHALIGIKMAEQLEVKLGKKIVVTMTDKKGDVISGLLRVKGIFRTGVDEVDRHVILAPLNWVRGLVGYGPEEVTQLAVQIDDYRNSDALAQALKPKTEIQQAVALPWYDAMPDIAATIAMDKSSNYFMQLVILILIGAGILNTVLMSVLERFREFGVMLAVGMTPRRLWWLVLAETFWISIIGILSGILISIPMYRYLATTGLDMSSFIEGEISLGNTIFNPVMKATIYMDHMAIILGGVFVLIMIAGLYPAYIASRTRPVDAIKTI